VFYDKSSVLKNNPLSYNTINNLRKNVTECRKAHFKIEVSDDPDFKVPIMYQNYTRELFKDPYDEVCTFSGKAFALLYQREQRFRIYAVS